MGYYYANQTLFAFLPLLLLFIFNSLLIRAVLYAARQRKTIVHQPQLPTGKRALSCSGSGAGGGANGGDGSRTERHGRDQQRITVMLIILVAVFLVCQMPQAVQKLYHVYLEKTAADDGLTAQQQLTLTITANYFNLLVMINSSVNFVLYSSFSTKFRLTFRRLFCKCLRKRRGAGVPDIMVSEMTSMPMHTRYGAGGCGGGGGGRSSVGGYVHDDCQSTVVYSTSSSPVPVHRASCSSNFSLISPQQRCMRSRSPGAGGGCGSPRNGQKLIVYNATQL